MRANLLLLIIMSFSFLAHADIHYTDYGNDWGIPINQEEGIDINDDGNIDFYVNQYAGELGVVPYALLGCFDSPAGDAYNNIGSRELTIHEIDDIVSINFDNLFDYIDGDRGSVYSSSLGFADGWENNEKQYIGFAVFLEDGETVMNGWMELSVDVDTETLYIHQMAYEDPAGIGSSQIIVGDTGIAPVSINEIEALHAVSLSPNPIIGNTLNIHYQYDGNEAMNIYVTDNSGKIVFKAMDNQNKDMSIYTDNWSDGLYFIRFETSQGIETKKLVKIK